MSNCLKFHHVSTGTDHHPSTTHKNIQPNHPPPQDSLSIHLPKTTYSTTNPPQPHCRHVPLQPDHLHGQHLHGQHLHGQHLHGPQGRQDSGPACQPPDLQRRVQEVRLHSCERQQVQALRCGEVSCPISLSCCTKQEDGLLTTKLARSSRRTDGQLTHSDGVEAMPLVMPDGKR
jgi:hypothetical protein